ncbi:DUF6891 domain-containing protein [Nonomuraea jiangxiensis]|uniref:DUF6891 domain-containing protein n=1 Tax=Nonomuraea jiangxiensis TaxID=633440 RepID=A0A1G8MIL6_9ACTN|nr:hypothetical protein [Nonomuraea jiangxiensis]SDI67779.1 hypothetical protein SAMN05421869_106423 [Nonomuraea jiangxiensis]
MLEITAVTEDGHRFVRPAEADIADLVGALGRPERRFLILQRIPDLPNVFMQVWHDGADYTVEHRDGGADRHFQVFLEGPEQVVPVMAAWARQADGWRYGLSWTPVDLGAPEPAPPLALDEDDRAKLDQRLREVIIGGYATRAELAEIAADYLVTGDHRPVTPGQARELADRLWLDRVEEQAAWKGETDPERLTRAFTALAATGITAKEHFTCCGSCGRSEIGEAGAPDARGFVFFHRQCTDATAAGGQGLTLLYGGFDGSPATTAAIGREVVAALDQAGLTAEWDGDPAQAITVTPITWRKRLIG